jgi:phenylacetate-coenzyme A ligase PaaK-like adenylate-forming protein
MSPTERPLDKVRSYLLPPTINFFAERSPFYKSHLSGHDHVRSLSDLPRLPLLTKVQAVQAGSDFHSRGITPLHMNTTSGTTGGEPLIYYTSKEELDATDTLLAQCAPTEVGEPLPVTLHIHTVDHGPEFLRKRDLKVVHFHTNSANAVHALPHLLKRDFEIDGKQQRIQRIITTVNVFKRLTKYFETLQIEPTDWGLGDIVISGNYLSSHFSAWLESSWGCHIKLVYGLSEIRGSTCVWCSEHGGYHFGPMVIPELVDPLTFETIQAGAGLLLLTTLYPFTQCSGFIRYSTGDLMEIVPGQEHDGEPTFVFRGRIGDGLAGRRDRATEYLIFSTDLVEFLDRTPEIERGYADAFTVFKFFEEVGYNRARIKASWAGKARALIEVVDDGTFRRDRNAAARFEDSLRSHLLTRNRAFGEALRQGLGFKVKFRPPKSDVGYLSI